MLRYRPQTFLVLNQVERPNQCFRLGTRRRTVSATTDWTLAAGSEAYVHLVQGRLTVNDVVLNAGDALKLTDETAVVLHDGDNAEVLVFDLPVS